MLRDFYAPTVIIFIISTVIQSYNVGETVRFITAIFNTLCIMFRNTIDGIDDIFLTEIPAGSVIVVSGPPGSLKSGLCYNLLSKHVMENDVFGVYMNLEQDTENHVRNMRSLGIPIPDDLFILDYSGFRQRFESKDHKIDFMTMVRKALRYFKKEQGERFSVVALDSLGALYSIIQVDEKLRNRVYNFFRFFKELGLTSLVVLERPMFTEEYDVAGGEEFLADGIVEMGILETRKKHEVFPFLQVMKMRAARHSRVKHHIDVTENGLRIIGPVF